MNIYVISPVRQLDCKTHRLLLNHTHLLEMIGHTVHLPVRDTDQTATAVEICTQNVEAIRAADRVDIYFDPSSKGSKFDLGAAYALKKPLCLINSIQPMKEKEFATLILTWPWTEDDQ